MIILSATGTNYTLQRCKKTAQLRKRHLLLVKSLHYRLPEGISQDSIRTSNIFYLKKALPPETKGI